MSSLCVGQKQGYAGFGSGYTACSTLDCKLCEGKELCVSVLPAVSLQSETAQYSIDIWMNEWTNFWGEKLRAIYIG